MGKLKAEPRLIVDEFVEKVIEEMARQGISQREVARRLGCTHPYLNRVLHKRQCPTLEWAEKLAAILGLELSVKKTVHHS